MGTAGENSGELCDVLDMGHAETGRNRNNMRLALGGLVQGSEPRVRRPTSVTLNGSHSLLGCLLACQVLLSASKWFCEAQIR